MPNFTKVTNGMTQMLMNVSKMIWVDGLRGTFNAIKMVLGKDPMLISPNYEKYFLLFSFSLDHTVVAILLQKNDKQLEQPIVVF